MWLKTIFRMIGVTRVSHFIVRKYTCFGRDDDLVGYDCWILTIICSVFEVYFVLCFLKKCINFFLKFFHKFKVTTKLSKKLFSFDMHFEGKLFVRQAKLILLLLQIESISWDFDLKIRNHCRAPQTFRNLSRVIDCWAILWDFRASPRGLKALNL